MPSENSVNDARPGDDSSRPERLYLVTPPRIGPDFAALLEGALAAAPVACVRIDLGAATEADWRQAVDLLMPACHAADVALMVTHHWQLVPALGLDGVHLVDPRVRIRDLRDELGENAIIGAFAGASRHHGLVLAEAGADYVAFGPVGETGLLGNTERATDELFQWWNQMIEVPSVAEGGVTEEAASRLASEVDFLVPDVSIWEDADPVARLAAYTALLA